MNDLIGQTLGKYRIISQVGKGGMATVFKAYQPSLDRSVAVKVLPPFYVKEDESFLKRFRQEARSVAKLRHPNILVVLDYGEQDDITYLVMEYVEAGTLTDLLSTPLDPEQIGNIIGQVAGALDHAHDQGIVHRDVKPSNILLPKPDWPLLTDFGLAKMVGGTKITQSGMMMGTPAYMSPEQGRGDKVDYRTDIYSLGVVVYEMATGVVPYSAETPMSVVVKHIIEPLPLPRSKNPEMTEATERVILKALAKDPEDRFQRASEMAEALKAAAAADPLRSTTVAGQSAALRSKETLQAAPQISTSEAIAQPSGSSDELGAVISRPGLLPRLRVKKWLIPAVLGTLVVLAGILILGPNIGSSSIGSPGIFAAPEATRTLDQHLADGWAYLDVGDTESAIAEFEAALAQDPGRTEVYWDIAKAYMNSGQHEKAFEVVEKAIAVAPDDAWTYESAGWFYQDMGQNQEAIAMFEKAIELSPDFTYLYFEISNAYRDMGQIDMATQVLEDALSADGGDNPGQFEQLGWHYMEMDRLEEAQAAFEKAIELDPRSTGAWSGLADLYWQQNDFETAIAVLERAIEENPNEVYLYDRLGWWYWEKDDLDAAIVVFEKAITVDPMDDQAYNGLAEIYRSQGDEEKALGILNEAIAAYPDNPRFYATMGQFYRNSNNARESIPYFEKALELDPNDGWGYLELAWAYRMTGQTEEAVSMLEEAGNHSWDDPGLLESIGTTYIELGDCDSAVEYFEQALEFQPDNEMAREGIKNCGA